MPFTNPHCSLQSVHFLGHDDQEGSWATGVMGCTLVVCRFDVEAVRSVRQFRGHTDRISDLHMSADARWLLSASLDGTTRVWDVPSSMCLQASRSLCRHSQTPPGPCRTFHSPGLKTPLVVSFGLLL